jgi:hypothetical protein
MVAVPVTAGGGELRIGNSSMPAATATWTTTEPTTPMATLGRL